MPKRQGKWFECFFFNAMTEAMKTTVIHHIEAPYRPPGKESPPNTPLAAVLATSVVFVRIGQKASSHEINGVEKS
jgi:hypothetical protein